jgi:hypothetical protein
MEKFVGGGSESDGLEERNKSENTLENNLIGAIRLPIMMNWFNLIRNRYWMSFSLK